jgi:hypothetical protein
MFIQVISCTDSCTKDLYKIASPPFPLYTWGRRGRNRIVAGFTVTCAISTCHLYSCQFESRSKVAVNTRLQVSL